MATWKDIPAYGGHYQASLSGKVRVKERIIIKPHSQNGALTKYIYPSKELQQFTQPWGHKYVRIGVDGEKMTLHVGRLVLMAFVGMPEDGQECCHNNGKSGDNRLRNLRWDTHEANNRDRLKHGTYSRGEKHHGAKITKKDVARIRRSKKTGKQLAEEYGLGQSQVSRIRRGLSWQ